uniref:Uncharacterized protein n=1 Tax=Thaumatella adunca TaxID=2006976 RepID=A0A1Z1MMV7_9FLOR|nr:hypothetical protein [Thaumatella adunca]ARW67417.1 hypothetical protein [Thaumatella adunca]
MLILILIIHCSLIYLKQKNSYLIFIILLFCIYIQKIISYRYKIVTNFYMIFQT